MIPKIKRRERDAILQSLQAGLVPRQGLHLIQVGRMAETDALLSDISRINDGGSSFRVIAGRFGSGKSFFLNLVRTVALKQDLAVAQADFTMERRLQASGGEAQALYSEMVRNLATRAKPEGGALESMLMQWISRIHQQVKLAGGDATQVEARLRSDISDMQQYVGGFEFAEVLATYYRAWESGNHTLQAAAVRWLRAEYTTKTEAREALGVRRIIGDSDILESLKLLAAFCRKAGYGGLLVQLDELVVLTHRLPSTRSRTANLEAILTLLNDSIQGGCSGIGFVLAGTDECLEDKRRGLFSYEALRTRLSENQLAREGLVDLSGPVIRLQPMSPEDLFVLLRNISVVEAEGDTTARKVSDEGIQAILHKSYETLGADFFLTPRDIVRSFVGMLNILSQNPGKTWQDVLGTGNVIAKQEQAASAEEVLARGGNPTEEEDDLASFKL